MNLLDLQRQPATALEIKLASLISVFCRNSR